MNSMQMSEGTSRESPTKRISVACRRCNQKKVKCIAPSGHPCNACRISQAECVLIDSQRGRYPRTKSRLKSARTRHGVQDAASPRTRGETMLTPGSPASPSFIANESPDMLYARIAEEGVSEHQQPVSDASQSVFLGEAFSLTYVVHDVLAEFLTTSSVHHRRLHFPLTIPPAGFGGTLSPDQIATRQSEYLLNAEIAYAPDTDVLNRLLDTYFDAFHPAFPIFNQKDFIASVANRDVSLMILNAVCMVAVTLCEDHLLSHIAAKDRYAARSLFYQQAKALYDADLEPHKLNNVIGVFLMSFWWSGPDDQKDSWHWLGIAASLAQSMGMHRSTLNSGVEPATARIWRRLWWAIRTRDVLVSGSIGRPQHISSLDCDVELTEVDDTEEVISDATTEQLLYAAQMARLTEIFSEIITCRYTPAKARHTEQRIPLEERLKLFRQQLPDTLCYNGVCVDGGGMWSAMLLLAWNYATILLCRPQKQGHTQNQEHQWGNYPMAKSAANEVSRVMEDILTASLARKCQIHCIPAMFNALAIHISTICQSEAMLRELTHNRAKTCMLGLTVLRESWPVGGWVYHLFASIMKRLQSRAQENSVQHQAETCGPRSRNTPHDIVRSELRGTRADWTPLQNSADVNDTASNFRQNHENLWTGFVDAHHVPDIFAFGDATLNAAGDQNAFFSMLDLPNWPDFQ